MRIDVTVQGITPLMMHRFSDEAALSASSGTSAASTGADRGSPRAQAEAGLYLGLDGKPAIPQPNLLRCLVEGGRYHKVGKVQVTTERKSLLYACLDIAGAEIAVKHEAPWSVDTRAVRIPATGGRILRHRPIFEDWSLSFEVDLDETILAPSLLRAIIDDAGKRVGLGDFRPATKGPYGKFVVTKWEVQPSLKKAA